MSYTGRSERLRDPVCDAIQLAGHRDSRQLSLAADAWRLPIALT